MKSTICLAEDRKVCEPSLKLLLLSLNMHCSEMAVNLCYPPAEDGFRNWIKKCPQVHLRTDHSGGQGWNVKPYAIMRLIDEGFDEVIWIDSDVIVRRDITQIFGQLHDDIFVATEDALGDDRDDRNALRARLWGFSVGRVLPFGLNSGVLRVTKNHYRLMARWRELLESNAYQDVQKRRWRERPVHMLGDQDVLTALLTSKEFAEIPIHILRKGKQILQFNGIYGYTVAERIGNLRGQSRIHSFVCRQTVVRAMGGRAFRWVEEVHQRVHQKGLPGSVPLYPFSDSIQGGIGVRNEMDGAALRSKPISAGVGSGVSRTRRPSNCGVSGSGTRCKIHTEGNPSRSSSVNTE